MAVFLVTWDLNKKRQNYDQARQVLIDFMSKYPHVKDDGLDSVWFIQSPAKAEAVSADIHTKMTGDDKLIVMQLVAGQYYGWLEKQVWEWINARL